MPDDANGGLNLASAPVTTQAESDQGKENSEFAQPIEFGRRLLELHRRIVASGGGLRGRKELEREIAERRGGLYLGEE